MSATIDLEQIRQKFTAYENLSKELYATQVHVSPLLKAISGVLEQSLEKAQNCEDYKQACDVLVQAINNVRSACDRNQHDFKSAGDICRGKSEAYKEILDSIPVDPETLEKPEEL
jgi:hypothetical protein